MAYAAEKERTIQGIVRQGLCIGCGTCAVLCPKSALAIVECQKTGTYLPRLDTSKCNRCGICLKTCPGIEADFNKLHTVAFNKKIEKPFVGNFVNCYSGHATDQDVRGKATSGGLIPALSMLALEIGVADGVLTTRASAEEPLRPKSFIARTNGDIMSSVGSKYCPVPVNSALKYVLGNQDRYVLIGLPCQIQSIRKAQALNEGLKNRISIIFGIACNHTPTFNATDFLLRRLRIPREKIAKLDYRSLGWPGGMNILMNDHEGHFVPFNSSYYWGYVFQKFFWQKRCMICNDKLCQLADIVFMDAWLPEFSSDKIGSSLIIVRSKNGEKLIAKAIEKGVVKLQPISIKLIEKSQILSTTIRKATARRFVLRYPFNNHLAIQNMSLTPSILDLIEAFHMVAVNRICGKTSMLSNTVIEFHKELWDIARFAKRLLKRI